MRVLLRILWEVTILLTWKDVPKTIVGLHADAVLCEVEPKRLRQGAGIGHPQGQGRVLVDYTRSKIQHRRVKDEVCGRDLGPECEGDGQALVGDVELRGIESVGVIGSEFSPPKAEASLPALNDNLLNDDPPPHLHGDFKYALIDVHQVFSALLHHFQFRFENNRYGERFSCLNRHKWRGSKTKVQQ